MWCRARDAFNRQDRFYIAWHLDTVADPDLEGPDAARSSDLSCVVASRIVGERAGPRKDCDASRGHSANQVSSYAHSLSPMRRVAVRPSVHRSFRRPGRGPTGPGERSDTVLTYERFRSGQPSGCARGRFPRRSRRRLTATRAATPLAPQPGRSRPSRTDSTCRAGRE